MSIDYTNIMKDKSAYLKEEEINDMLEYCWTRYQNMQEPRPDIWIRNYMLVLTLYRTGRRITEILGERPYTKKVGLRPCDIHDNGSIEWDILKKNHIKSFTNKGRKKNEEKVTKQRLNKSPVRKLKPVDDEYYEFLLTYIKSLNITPTTRVFQINRKRADQIIKYIAQECKINRAKMKIHCHMFRHSYAINLLQKNKNNPSTLRYVQQSLDHSNINVTMTYAQFNQDDIKEVLDKTFTPLSKESESVKESDTDKKKFKPKRSIMSERIKYRLKNKKRGV